MSFDWTSLIGPLIGAAGAYSGARAGGPATTTQNNTPTPEWQGQWNAYSGFANNLANQPYQARVAPFTQDQYGAMDMIRGAAGGTPETFAGSQALQGFLTGGAQNPYMGDNPYMQGLMNNTLDQVQNRMNTAAFSSGSFGNSGVAQQAAKGYADAANNLQYQHYQNSAGLAENALNRTASMIPQALGYGQLPFQNASALLQSGAMQQQLGQRYMDDYYGYGDRQLGYMGMPLGFGQNFGQQSMTQPGNVGLSALGGGLLGLQLGNMFTPPPAKTT